MELRFGLRIRLGLGLGVGVGVRGRGRGRGRVRVRVKDGPLLTLGMRPGLRAGRATVAHGAVACGRRLDLATGVQRASGGAVQVQPFRAES